MEVINDCANVGVLGRCFDCCFIGLVAPAIGFHEKSMNVRILAAKPTAVTGSMLVENLAPCHIRPSGAPRTIELEILAT